MSNFEDVLRGTMSQKNQRPDRRLRGESAESSALDFATLLRVISGQKLTAVH